MKMSLCNTFRSFAVSLAIVLSLIDAPVNTFTIRRSGQITETIRDMNQEDEQFLNIKNDLKKPININLTKDGLIVTTESFSKNNNIKTSQDQSTDTSFYSRSLELKTEAETTDNNNEAMISNKEAQNNLSGQGKYTYVSHNLASSEAKQLSSWRKYSLINRKQNLVPLDSNKTEGTTVDETGIPNQDSKSADIPSLNQIKNFLFPSGFFKSEAQNDTITSTELIDKTMRDDLETTNEPATTEKGIPATVESKRGGFLDFSLKSLFEDSGDKKDSSQENNSSRPKGRRLSWRFGSRYRGKEDSSAEKDKERSRFRLRNNKDRKIDNNNTKESKEVQSKELESKEDSDRTRSRPKNHDDENSNKKYKYSDGDGNNYSKTEEKIEKNNYFKNEKSRSDAENDKETLAKWNQYERNQEKTKNEHFKQSKESNDVNKLQQNINPKTINHNKNSREEINKEYMAKSKEKTTTDINIWKYSADEKSQSRYINSKEISKEEGNKRGQRINESKSKERNDNNFRFSSNDGEEITKENNNKNLKHEKYENKIKENNRDYSIYYDNRSQSQMRNEKNSREINDEQRKDKTIKENEKYKSQIKKDGYERINNNNDKTSDEFREEIHRNDKDQFSSSYAKTTTSTEYKTFPQYHTQQYFELNNDREKSRFENANATTKQNQYLEINKENNKQAVDDSEKPIKIEYIKQYLSTIDEDEENENKTPTVEDGITTIQPKQTEVPNVATVKYPSVFNDINTTPEIFKPHDIPNLLINLPSPRNRDGIQGYSRSNGISNMQDTINREKDDTHGIHSFEETSPVIDAKQYSDIVQGKKETNSEVYGDLKENNNTTNERQTYHSENNNIKETEAVIQMNEDTRKEELLKEEVINNYENFGRYKEDYRTTTQAINSIKLYEVNKKLEVKENNTFDEKLIVKPLSFLEKLKTTMLYPVGINYKPPKKIEVQPPKSFLRDPDDNSWRNESLSSLGIVFKPKNSSKPFTQVLKNKTETEWNNLIEKANRNETPDLRERLEKIAEIRKTKKKKTDAFGNVIYNDYDETYSRETSFSKDTESSTSTIPTSTLSTESPVMSIGTVGTTTDVGHYNISVTKSTTEKSKKIFSVAEYYDTSDEDDADYLRLAKIDLKKFTIPNKNSNSYVTTPSSWPVTNIRFEDQRYRDRKPALQYFPPLTTQKIVFKDYENDFHQKMGTFTDSEPPTNVLPVSFPKLTTSIPKAGMQQLFTPNFRSFLDTTSTTKPMEYETQVPDKPNDKEGFTFVTDDGSFNRAADVIKHYRDFLNAVAKDHDEDKNMEEYHPLTQIPTQVVTMSDVMIDHKMKSKPEMGENYDYENNFRKEVLQRFVHNFNQDSERFKSDLPLLYNNSVIHGGRGPGGDVASSRAYLSRMLTRPLGECDNSTAELSPAYELQYYVPEQEEKEEVDLKPVTLPYQYRYEN